MAPRSRPRPGSPRGGWPAACRPSGARAADLETAYCAQVLAVTTRPWGCCPVAAVRAGMTPGGFGSGDNLGLSVGFQLGGEIAVHIPAGAAGLPRTPAA